MTLVCILVQKLWSWKWKLPYLTKCTALLPLYSPIVCYKALPQTQLPENIHHYFHWCVVCHGERAHIKYASELQRSRAFCWKWWGMLGKTYPGTANNPLLLLSSTFFKKDREGGKKQQRRKNLHSWSKMLVQTDSSINTTRLSQVSIATALSPGSGCAKITKAIYPSALVIIQLIFSLQ